MKEPILSQRVWDEAQEPSQFHAPQVPVGVWHLMEHISRAPISVPSLALFDHLRFFPVDVVGAPVCAGQGAISINFVLRSREAKGKQ